MLIMALEGQYTGEATSVGSAYWEQIKNKDLGSLEVLLHVFLCHLENKFRPNRAYVNRFFGTCSHMKANVTTFFSVAQAFVPQSSCCFWRAKTLL